MVIGPGRVLALLPLLLLAACKAGVEAREDPLASVEASLTPAQREALAQSMAQAEPAPSEAAESEAAPALSLPPAHEERESPRNDGIHDPSNPALPMLQEPSAAMGRFPRDRRGQVNWVETLAQGLISPRADLMGEGEMKVMDMDILMKGTQFMPWVLFPHSKHTQWLDCSNCHDAIFEPQVGANDISMNAVLQGEFCGVCHDKVAFSLFVCERCHSVPHAGSGEKWW